MLVKALNEHSKLPKYIVVVMEDDIIRCINFSGMKEADIIAVFNQCINWLLEKYHKLIKERKELLPKKASKFLYPQVFWVALPLHHNFDDNSIEIRQFNQVLESIAGKFKETKTMKIRRHWSYNDSSVTPAGIINETGKIRYWSGIDECIEFWENGKKKSKPGNNGRTFIRNVHREHQFASGNNFNRNKDNRFCWERKQNKQVKLPQPPKM